MLRKMAKGDKNMLKMAKNDQNVLWRMVKSDKII